MLGRFRFGIPNLKEHETTFLNLDIDHHILLFGKILLTKHDLWWGHWDFVAVCPRDLSLVPVGNQTQADIASGLKWFKCTIARAFPWISHCHVWWHRRVQFLECGTPWSRWVTWVTRTRNLPLSVKESQFECCSAKSRSGPGCVFCESGNLPSGYVKIAIEHDHL